VCQSNEKRLTFSLKPVLTTRELLNSYSWEAEPLTQVLQARHFCSLFVC